MQKQKVLIIGAGLGGLATALRLASRGFEVEIVEKYHQPGGRLNQFVTDGFTFDLGPSFFSMSYEFEEFFKDCGISNPLKLRPLDPLYAVYFPGRKDPFLVHKDPSRLTESFKDVEPGFSEAITRYLKKAEEIFRDTEYRVVKKNFDSKLDYLLSLTRVPPKHAFGMFRSMWNELGSHFKSNEVKVILSLVAFFLGGTPFDTPGIYSLLTYMELKHDGYWNVEGGMYTITETIVKLLEEGGVQIHYNTEIIAPVLNQNIVSGFTDQHGKTWKADHYVVNADAAAFRGSVMGRRKFSMRKLDRKKWTLAPFTIYLGVRGKISSLHHHNYFLGENFYEYANTIFKTSVAPSNPYYYVNVSSRSNPESAPPGCENIFILCPVPDLRYKTSWEDAPMLAEKIIADLSLRVNFDFAKQTITKTVLTPEDWQNRFNLYRGSGLGLAHGMNQIGGFRPSNKDESMRNLYYVGASTIPGTGLPMVIISSKLVTDRILQHV
jgi:phytoene desaturase